LQAIDHVLGLAFHADRSAARRHFFHRQPNREIDANAVDLDGDAFDTARLHLDVPQRDREEPGSYGADRDVELALRRLLLDARPHERAEREESDEEEE